MYVLKRKKGSVVDLQYMPLFTLIFAAIIIFFLFAYAKSWDDSTYLKRNYFAKDIGSGIDTLLLSPGDVSLTYHKELENFILEVKDGKVSVSSMENNEVIDTATYSFITIKDFTIAEGVYPLKNSKGEYDTKKFNIEFQKSRTKLIIPLEGESQDVQIIENNPETLIKSIVTKNNDWKDKKIQVEFIIPQKTQLYDDNLDTYLSNACILFKTENFVSKEEGCTNNKDVSEAILKLYFSFNIDSSMDNKVIIYYFDEDRSLKLAQIIKNQLNLGENSEIKYIDSYPARNMLPSISNIPGVLIDIGKKDSYESSVLFIGSTGRKIYSSLGEYYK